MIFYSLNQSYKLFRFWVFLRPFSVMLIVVIMVGLLLMVQTKMKDLTHKNGIFVQFNGQEEVLVKNLELKKLQNWSSEGENVLISNSSIHKNGNFVQFNGQEEVLVKNLEPKKQKNWSSEGQNVLINNSPYYNWELFAADYEEMVKTLKIFVYPDAFMSNKSSPFSSIFLPLTNPFDPKLGNYFSEHMFKIALLGSSLVNQNPKEAHFYYMPFSINVMRNHPRVHSAAAIEDFVAGYTDRVRSEFRFWNASGGADHFYVYCHSIGRAAASKHQELHHNAIQVTCSSNYFQRLYVAHKDIGLPQVWPRQHEEVLNPPDARYKLVFFAGRVQNSLARRDLLELWKNDSSFDIFSGSSSFPYKEGFRRSRYCLHVKGYEVNTARVSDAIQHGCVPVLISNYYDLPLANILDWSKFSIIVNEKDIPHLKKILLSVPKQMYLNMYKNLGIVRKHFAWYSSPKNYDSFHMTVYQLWLRRGLHRVAW
ncbi:putative glycosyltransferase At3g07620 [Nicotiana tabacum]|uniref:Glycosyltransferase At3g07620 n=2 Tax=Nicotiana TaxID=4085 RepID=A0A1S4CF38_TOBAC|nr:PREDICTED: probable glycosyltransferase At3g07620 [Nicotiana sylvestris]XP_016499797.1 PREDICTED: probable glycosyltransferase At3g07620 [Nicotiana tabacum]